MAELFSLVWLASLVSTIFFGVEFVRKKSNKSNLNLTDKQCKTILLASIITFIISFIVVGATAPSIEQTPEYNTLYENNINENITQENCIQETTNTVIEEVFNEIYNNEIIEDYKENKEELENIKTNLLSNIPQYSSKPYITINDNKPFFTDSDLTTTSYETYSNLDDLGRCGVAIANIGKDIMPTEERGDIGSVKPTGWHSVRYNGIDGNYLYNRCHLIGFQLSGENANIKNLITGTRYLNVEGMLPFENMIADYIKETDNHVLYRVTPIFEGNNLLASGVLMEAKSVEDDGDGIEFNVYCYNVQPGIEIIYSSGKSSGPEYTGTTSNKDTNSNTSSSKDTSSSSIESSYKKENTATSDKNKTESSTTTTNTKSQTYILNTNSKKFHKSSCGSAKRISAKNKDTFTGSRSELIKKGYSPCKNCDP